MNTSFAHRIAGLLLAVLLPCAAVAQTAPLACDVDRDRDVDRVDIAAINAARNQPASGPTDPRDFDRDGLITTTDARACTLRCTLPQCASPSANRAPIANAGADQLAFPGVTVTLNGTASTDPDGNALTYRWTLAVRPTGSTAALANATSSMPTFVPDRAGDYRIDLIVNDGSLDSAVDSVVVTTENVPPVANAGPDQVVVRGATVTLDGTGSTDANGDPLTYQWTFVAFPGATPPALLTGGARPTFVAASAGTYRVQLVVNDGRVSSTADFVVVTTEPPPNTPPVANAGPDQRVALGALVVLDGSGSSDADGNPLTYRWSLTSQPTGSSAALANATGVSPTFTADRAGNYVAQLIVNDGTVDSVADTVLVSTTNTPPVANAGADQTVTQGDTVALNGNGSSDADGDPLTFAWSFSSSPGATPPAIAGANTPTPTFVAAAAGLYVAQLVVNDGTVDSAPDTASITVEVRANRAPTAVNDAATTAEDTAITVAVLGNDSDPDTDPLTVTGVSQPANGSVTTNGTTVTFTPAADFNGQTSFTYSISDGRGGTSSATVLLTVTPVNDAPVARADAASTASGTPVDVPVLTNDEDVDGDTLTIQSVGTPSSGTAAIVGNQIRYTPAPGFAGPATFTYTISDGRGGTASATVTVTVGGLPSLSIGDVSVNEGDAGTTLANFTVTLSAPSGASVTVAYATADGTAAATSDYVAASGTLTFAPGETTQTIGVVVNGDTTVEPNETFLVNLSVPANATLADAQGQGTIVNDDQTVLVTVVATTPSVPEQGPGAGAFTVSRTGSTAAPLTVALTLAGTATPATDFAGIATSVTIPAGQSTATVTITPADDALVEGDETVVLTIAAGAGYAAGTPGSATVTIVENDFTPTVTIAATTATVPEQGPGTGVFTIARAGGGGSIAAPLTVALTRTGTATAAVDYAGFATSVTIPAGQASTTVAIAPADDALVEGDETVVLTLAANAAYTIGTPSAATVTIVENDFTPTVAIAATTPTVPEQGPGAGVFTVTRSGGGGSDAAPLTVALTRTGTATPGADYAGFATSVTIPANATSATVTIAPVNDALVEGAETVVLTLGTSAAYTIGTPNSATVTIVDDDLPAIVLTPNPLVVTAGETATLTLTLGGTAPASAVTVALASSAPANATVPASVVVPAGQTGATVTVTGVAAGSTTITASASGYTAGTALVNVAAAVLPTVTIAATDPSAAEAPLDAGTFTITRTGPTTASLTVTVAYGGSAANGTDYQSLATSVTLAAGQTAATLTVTPVDDALVEGGETVVATLQANAAYTLGTPSSATVTIADDDLRPTVTVTAEDADAGEAGPNIGVFRISRSGGGGSNAAALSVTVAYSGSAASGTDYGALPTTVIIPANQTSATLTLTPVNDALVEGAETATLSLQAAAEYTVGVPASATITIADDEAAPLLSVADVAGNEGDAGNAPLTFTVTLSVASATTVTVDYATADGTATAGSDYLATSGTLTFAPGTTSLTVPVQIVGDTTVEPSETFQLQLANATGGATVFTAAATGTITNDDPVRLVTIADVSQNEGDSGTTAFLFAVRLDAPAIGPVTVDYQTVASSAVAGSDFVATNGTLTFSAGEVERTIAVDVVGDTTQEPNETFSVQLSNPNANGALVDSVGVGTILNDDVTITLTFDPTFLQVPIGSTRQLTVRRNVAAGTGGAVVTLATANPAIATVPATVTIPEGQTSVAFTVTAAGTIGQQTQVTASGAGATTSATATVALTGGAVVVPAPVRVGFDLQQAVNVSLPAAPPSATTVTVSVPANSGVTLSTSPSVEGSSSVTFTNVTNSGSLTVYVQGRTVGATTIVTASAPNYADGTFAVTVDPSGYAFYAVSSSTVTQSAPGTLSVQVWSIRLVPGTLEFADWQSLRGGRTATIGFTSSVPAAGTVTPSVTIAAGGSSANVTFSAVAPNPATNPDTRVSIVQPAGFTATSSASFNARTQFDIELVGAAINAGAARDVGRGLQVFNSASLGSTSPTPVSVTLSVPPGSGVLLAPNASTVGTETLVIPGVTSSFSYYVQGGAVTSAPVTITASAPGYSNGTTTANITPSGFAFYAVGEDPTTVDLTSSRLFQIWSVRLQPGTLAFADWQATMPGTAYSIVVTNSNPAAGTVTNSPLNFAGGASSVNATFQPAAGSPNTTTLAIVQPSGFSETSSAVFNARARFGVTVNSNVQRIGVAAIDASATEAGTPPGVAVYRITRTGPGLASAVNVSWAMSGTAVQTTDYTLSVGGTNVNSSVNIPANQASVDVVLTPVKDTLLDDGETAVMTLLATSAYIVDPATPASVTIADDPTFVSVATLDATATEAGQTTATFRLTRSGGNVASTQHVEFVIGGTAAISSDYLATGPSWGFWQSPDVYRVIFPAGATTADVTITPQLDQLVEPSESVTLTLRASTNTSSGYQIATPAAVSATIADDPPVVAVALVDGAAAEATLDSGVLRFTRTGGSATTSLQVLFALEGTATVNTDYTATGGSFGFWRSATPPIYRVIFPANTTQLDVTFAPVRDNAVESGGENIVVTLVANEVSGQGYDVAPGGTGPVTVTIADDPPVVTLTAIDASAAEQPLDTATLRFARTGGNPALSLQAEFQIGGTAAIGTDYTGSGSNFALLASGPPAVYRVIFPASATTADATITPVNDTVAEPTETATFTLVPSASTTVGTPGSASVSITSNE